MNRAKITRAERIAALEEQKERMNDRSSLAQQMQVCADNRDALADRLNRVIAIAEWRRSRNGKYEYQLAELRNEVARLHDLHSQVLTDNAKLKADKYG